MFRFLLDLFFRNTDRYYKNDVARRRSFIDTQRNDYYND